MVFTRYYSQSITAPANTPIAAPVSITPVLETNHLCAIEIDVPDGHDRQTGIQFLNNGTVIIPFSQNGFIVANDHYFNIPFDDDVTQGDITVRAYNTDVFDHTFYVRFVIQNSASPLAANVVSAQIPGTVTPGSDQAVAGLAVTPDVLAAAAALAPPAPPAGPPAAPDLGVA